LITNLEEKINLSLFLERSNQIEKICEALSFFIKKLELKDIVWCDIGAGDGTFTKQISKKVLNNSPFLILEPCNNNFELLKVNLKGYKTHFFKKKLEEFVKSNLDFHNSCNLAIASHVMYYAMNSSKKIHEWVNSFLKLIVPGGVGFIVHQSKNGGMYNFFDVFADDKRKLLPEDFLGEYIEKEKEFTVTISCDNFDDFLEIGYFLLIDPRENFSGKHNKIKDFLKNNYYDEKKDCYTMRQTQKLYQIRRIV